MDAQVGRSGALPVRALPDVGDVPAALLLEPSEAEAPAPVEAAASFEPEPVAESDAVSVDAAFPSPPAPSLAVAAEDPDAALERASFLAQPLPLKWIAGVLRAFFIAPPHTSQVSGPVPEIAWMTSTERPQDVQRYS
jgi:hypothetical protein